MGILSFLTGGGSKGAAELTKSITDGVRDIRNTFSKTLPPDQQAEFDLKFNEIEERMSVAQAEIGKIEAASPRFFVAGARPMILWICAAALFMNFILAPILGAWGVEVPTLDINMLYPLMLGMLGLGGLRTYEKSKGVQGNH